MFVKAVFPGKYIQGEHALAQLPQWVGFLGNRGLILASGTVKSQILSRHTRALEENSIITEHFRGECCERELDRVGSILAGKKIDVLVGMGGGKVIDTAKIAAGRAGIPVIIVPTIASNDAPCSGCAVIYSEEGTFQSVSYQKMNPHVVLVDTAVIAAAPSRFLVAGMGDALATWFEARSCDRSKSANECGGLSPMAGLSIARLCYETLLAYGVAAKLACEQKIVTPALERIIEANILLSGIGFESSGLAAAHSIHNGLTALEETHSFYHGEKVAFGVVSGLALSGASPEETDAVYTFCEQVGLPTTLADIGLKGVDRGRLLTVAEKACAPGEAIHHEVGEMTPRKVLSAMIAADAIGDSRKRTKGSPSPL